jgi:hypothetical protein
LFDLCEIFTNLPFIFNVSIQFCFFIFQSKLVLLMRDIFGKRVIIVSRNLQRVLYLGTNFFCKRFL